MRRWGRRRRMELDRGARVQLAMPQVLVVPLSEHISSVGHVSVRAGGFQVQVLLVLKEAASIGGAPFYVILRSFIVLHFFYIPLPAIAAFTTARHVAFSVAFEGYVGIWNTPGVNPTPKNARRAEAASSSHRYPSRPGPHQRCVGIERFPILNQLGR